jgi:23S rRNA (cytosine1962-C5)-methyltransferase
LKLERFGAIKTIRPEPQAVWTPSQPIEKWEKEADVRFVPKSSSSGEWKKLNPKAPDQWSIEYKVGALKTNQSNSV